MTTRNSHITFPQKRTEPRLVGDAQLQDVHTPCEEGPGHRLTVIDRNVAKIHNAVEPGCVHFSLTRAIHPVAASESRSLRYRSTQPIS